MGGQGSHVDDDVRYLEHLGYKQQLTRVMGIWSNFALGFTYLSPLVGIYSLFGYALATGREGMGGGDIKLLAMIGAFLGWQGVLLTLLLASFIGSIVGVVWMVARGADSKLAIPFGPFLALGALVTLFWGDTIIRWYLSTLS